MFSGEWHGCLLVALAVWRPLRILTLVPIMFNFFPLDIVVCIYAQILFENGNLMVIVMNVDLMDQKKQKGGECRREKAGLFRCVGCRRVFTRTNDSMETWLFFCLCFPPRTQGSRLVQEGRALPWYTSLEGFLQATSRLFGCHWDCLKRICFCTILQGAPHQEKVDHPWALDTAFMHLSILRRIGWASVCKLGVWHHGFPQSELTFNPTCHSSANLVYSNY